MRLSAFILANMESILQAWEDFARSLDSGVAMSVHALRDHAEQMLRFIAADLETSQSHAQQFDKSIGRGPQLEHGESSAAHTHGHARAVDHFSLAELVSEYRALRASVTRMWLDANPLDHDSALQLVRFNEAMDQILAESIVRFAKKLDADADLLVATIAHDLRSPLNAVVMTAQVLSTSATVGPTDREHVDRIKTAAARIAGMLQELHDFTRATLSSPGGYHYAPVDVAALCRRTAQEAEAAYPGQRVTVDAAGDTTADVDAGRFTQLVANLVANAIQHGGGDQPVSIRLTGAGDRLALDVHNDGPPIEPSLLPTLFEPLHRGRTHRIDATGSLGLGLYIVRMIARGHGGTVTVDSAEGRGTTFSVRIPRLGVAAPA